MQSTSIVQSFTCFLSTPGSVTMTVTGHTVGVARFHTTSVQPTLDWTGSQLYCCIISGHCKLVNRWTDTIYQWVCTLIHCRVLKMRDIRVVCCSWCIEKLYDNTVMHLILGCTRLRCQNVPPHCHNNNFQLFRQHECWTNGPQKAFCKLIPRLFDYCLLQANLHNHPTTPFFHTFKVTTYIEWLCLSPAMMLGTCCGQIRLGLPEHQPGFLPSAGGCFASPQSQPAQPPQPAQPSQPGSLPTSTEFATLPLWHCLVVCSVSTRCFTALQLFAGQ